MFQQQALMSAAQGAYISPVQISNGQLQQVNGAVTPTSGKDNRKFRKKTKTFLYIFLK
jgi:hypothetical protein